MTLQDLGSLLVAVVLIGWIGFRQLNWRPVVVSRMWRFPLILAVAGVFTLSRTTDLAKISVLDIGVLAVELVISLGIGAVMGKMAQFRPIAHPDTTAEHVATIESRTGWWGFGLWIALFAVRIGMDVIASHMGAEIASSTGIILLLIGANRAARTAVFAYRLDRKTAVAA
jgi:hypothetical protein